MPTAYAKLSTTITIPFGPVLDSAGAEYTGLVVGDVKISKNNGTPAALNGSATLTHKEVGVYELVLTTSDISAVGQATLTCSKTTYIAPPVTLVVLPAKVYDSIVGGTDNLEIDAIQWLGTAVSTPTVAGVPNVNAKTWNDLATVALPIVPTVAGRSLDVSTGGEAGLDWANVGNQSTTVNLSGTTVKTLTDAVTLPTMPTDWITAAGLSAGAGAELQALITGGAYALSTDSNGRIRSVVGTAAGEHNLSSGNVTLTDASLTTAKLGTFALAKTTNITGFNDIAATDVWAAATRTLTANTNLGFPSNFSSLVISAGGTVNADAIAISTDTAAADALETMLDGTGGNTFSLGKLAVAASGTNNAVEITGGSGGGHGIISTGGGTNKYGMYLVGSSAGVSAHGFRIDAGVSGGHGLAAFAAVGGSGGIFTAGPTGKAGLQCYGGAGTAVGIYGWGGLSGAAGAKWESTGNFAGEWIIATGTEPAWYVEGNGEIEGTMTFTGAVIATHASNQVSLGTDMLTSGTAATSLIQEIRNAITGGAYALNTDSNGSIRVVSGSATGETGQIATAVWAAATRTLTAGTNIALAKGTGLTGLNDIAVADILDLADAIETGVTVRKALRATAAKSAGLISGAGTGTEVIKGIGQTSGGTTRLTATVDGSGNISAWALNL